MGEAAAMTPQQTDLVTLKIDGKEVKVPKGTNLIEAAKSIGVEIPHYCYHPDLSVPGNCRMCQIEIKGQPKLNIGCATPVQEGMEVSTHHTSKRVEDSQAATLEFILINHPLDCTVCDQAGHCKLQDYHYDYNARPSRFVEEKVHKPKAKPLGPTVMLDAERCIMCTRCVRFCDEVTRTGELGMINRGDRAEITVNPDVPLNNPLSGSVVDLCPVGALTHREWRFNTRIWYTQQSDTICLGCSTGCNVKVAVRDNNVVHVKARYNKSVNKEWLCDEGRYGFDRFIPKRRVTSALVNSKSSTLDDALKNLAKLKSEEILILAAPNLLLEEYWLLKELINRDLKSAKVALAYKERELSKTQAILISPDFAANFRGAEFAGVVSGELSKGYTDALSKLRSGAVKNLLVVGDWSIMPADLDDSLIRGIQQAQNSFGILCDAGSKLSQAVKTVLPGRSPHEKSGLFINRSKRLQYAQAIIDFPDGSEPEWRILNQLAGLLGKKLIEAKTDRELTLAYLSADSRLKDLNIGAIKGLGVALNF